MQQAGFSLLELVIVIAIVAIAAAIGIPNFRDTIQNNRIITQANELLTAVAHTRNAAIQQNTAVRLCASADPEADSAACKEDATDWSEGWIVIADSDRDGDFDADDTQLVTRSLIGLNLTVSCNGGATLDFNRTGLPVGFNNGTCGVCDDRAVAQYYDRMRNVVISAAGRARVVTPESAGDVGCE